MLSYRIHEMIESLVEELHTKDCYQTSNHCGLITYEYMASRGNMSDLEVTVRYFHQIEGNYIDDWYEVEAISDFNVVLRMNFKFIPTVDEVKSHMIYRG